MVVALKQGSATLIQGPLSGFRHREVNLLHRILNKIKCNFVYIHIFIQQFKLMKSEIYNVFPKLKEMLFF